MKIYFSAIDAISYLENKGYVNDFMICRDELLWVQKKTFISIEQFVVDEYHKMIDTENERERMMLFAIYSSTLNVKGILLNHYRTRADIIPPMIALKLKAQKPSFSDKD